MTKSATIFLCSVFTALAGCASGVASVAKYYDGPERSEKELAVINFRDSFSPRGDRLSYDWISTVLAVNGKPVKEAMEPGASRIRDIRVLPGKHRFQMSCETNPYRDHTKNFKSQTVEIEVTVKAGNRYYPWCSLDATVIAGTGAAGIIPGTIVGRAVAGRAVPFLSTKRVP